MTNSKKTSYKHMNRLPTLRQLSCLVSLGKHRHFGKAANECCITQSAFSIKFKKLEGILGNRLADRSGKYVVLTPFGLDALKHAKKVLVDASDMVADLESVNKPLIKELYLGVIPTIAPFLLPRTLKKLTRRYSALKPVVKEDQTQALYQDLMSGALDLILVALPFDFKNVEIFLLFQDHFMLAYSKDTTLFNPDSYSESKLPNSSILLLEEGHCLRKHALSACKLSDTNKINPCTTNNLYTLMKMVDNDLGITFVPQIAIEGGLLAQTNIEVRLMKDNVAYREIGFIWRKNSPCRKEFRLFAESFRQLAPVSVSIQAKRKVSP